MPTGMQALCCWKSGRRAQRRGVLPRVGLARLTATISTVGSFRTGCVLLTNLVFYAIVRPLFDPEPDEVCRDSLALWFALHTQ